MIKKMTFLLVFIPFQFFAQSLTMIELNDEEAYDAIGRYKETDVLAETIITEANVSYEFALIFNNEIIYREPLDKTTKSYLPSIRFNKSVGFCFEKSLLDSETILTLIQNNIVNFGGKNKDFLCKTYFPIFKKEGNINKINHLYSPIFETKIYKVTYTN